MQIFKFENNTQKQENSIEKNYLTLSERKERDEHLLRIGTAIVFTGLLCVGVLLTSFLIFLYCLQVIILPFYIISPLVLLNLGCLRFIMRRVTDYLFPIKKI